MATKIIFENNVPIAREQLELAIKQWANATGGEMVNLTHRDRANRGTPVDTGRLRNSMAYATSRDNKTVYVGSNVEYAPVVEDGAQGRSGAHMLRNAVMDVEDFAEDFLQFALEANKSP